MISSLTVSFAGKVFLGIACIILINGASVCAINFVCSGNNMLTLQLGQKGPQIN